jgi:hypothetical protein
MGVGGDGATEGNPLASTDLAAASFVSYGGWYSGIWLWFRSGSVRLEGSSCLDIDLLVGLGVVGQTWHDTMAMAGGDSG